MGAGAGAVSSTFDVLDVSVGFETRDLAALDLDILKGLETLRLAVTVNGVPQIVDVNEPVGGWTSLADVTGGIQTAFDAAGIDITVGTNTPRVTGCPSATI